MSLQGYPLVGVPFVSVINETNTRDYPLLGVLLDSFVDVNASISGAAGTGAAGTATVSIQTGALTGAAGTGAAGTVGIFAGTTVSITGAAGTGAAGSLTVENDHTITGVAGTSAIGSVTPSTPIVAHPTGVQATGAVGSLTPEVLVTETGQQSTVAIGTLTTDTSMSASLAPGLQIDMSIGQPFPAVVPNIVLALVSGVSSTAAVTAPTVELQVIATGVSSAAGITAPTVITYPSVALSCVELQAVAQAADVREVLVTLRWSDTDAASWQGSRMQSLGLTGEYLTNIQYRRVGYSRRGRVFELSWSAPLETALNGATVTVEIAGT